MLRHRLLVEESLAEISGQLVFGSTKSHTHRSVPVPKSLMERLGATLDGKGPDELVFTSPQGGPLRYRNFLGRVWHPTLKRLGLSVVGIHTLRHSAAARIVAAGGSAKTLQVVLGHRSAGFSLTTYAHLFDADLDDLAERLEATSGVKTVSRLEDFRPVRKPNIGSDLTLYVVKYVVRRPPARPLRRPQAAERPGSIGVA